MIDQIINKIVQEARKIINQRDVNVYQALLLIAEFCKIENEIIRIIIEDIAQHGEPQLYKAYQKILEQADTLLNKYITGKNLSIPHLLMILTSLSKLNTEIMEKVFVDLVEQARKYKQIQ